MPAATPAVAPHSGAVLLTITLEPRVSGSVGSGESQRPPKQRWGTIHSPPGETRVTDLYLLEFPTGAIHSRGKAECIWSHMGKPDEPAYCPALI